jgi:CBS-domain-containing membrane protein
MNVRDVMTTDVVTVAPAAPLKEVAEVLVEHRITGVPVVSDDGEVLGVVSEGDILFKERGPMERKGVLGWLSDPYGMEGQLKLEARTAADAMSTPAKTIASWWSTAAAAALMLDAQVNRLPVVDNNGRLVGIVTRGDLVRAFVRSDEEIAREIREDVLRRTFWLDAPDAVTVQVAAGKVTLTGVVDTRTDAELVPAVVRKVPGVIEVDAAITWRGDNERRR